ncbi:hypothetical protein EMIHUDRAFT_226705 [Emiliania huxleyi CCMP1516]|uniref:Uncharacterized protein n=2 Tax=Emiliania huxleyi TaxID=2903 RepID=A0A0D3KK53_EMIH1|nr:hypothetical protein EMIHUDRAFT_226705 [Emiliania huxleyi CCMP1516]EOD36138.1 hypothetical protein EMIHUDRAFT_226705 [Emiliania huxleyi CCMP1516]|eukprot:XP_005788567.1 hypothetical protein EMIHUDRAFT_226705 [Emiliania huxleyi CCMP1516]
MNQFTSSPANVKGCGVARLRPPPRTASYPSDGYPSDGYPRAVLSWGEGERGCLGHGEDLSNQLLPKKVETWAQGQ